METSYFLYSTQDENVDIKRFHNCTWEFDNKSSLVEFGFEIEYEYLKKKKEIGLSLSIPWLTKKCVLTDLYEKLRVTDNSKFIFNDSVTNMSPLGVQIILGCIHQFSTRNAFCLLPTKLKSENKKVNINIDLSRYHQYCKDELNVYVRFSIKPHISYISTRKDGIAK